MEYTQEDKNQMTSRIQLWNRKPLQMNWKKRVRISIGFYTQIKRI